MNWLKRFRKSGPYVIVVSNIVLALIICGCCLLFPKIYLQSDLNHSRIFKIFLIVLTPSYIVLPLFISRMYFDYKHRNDKIKEDTDWNEGLYEIFKISTVALFVLMIIIAFTVKSCSNHKRGPDYYRDTEYWETL